MFITFTTNFATLLLSEIFSLFLLHSFKAKQSEWTECQLSLVFCWFSSKCGGYKTRSGQVMIKHLSFVSGWLAALTSASFSFSILFQPPNSPYVWSITYDRLMSNRKPKIDDDRLLRPAKQGVLRVACCSLCDSFRQASSKFATFNIQQPLLSLSLPLSFAYITQTGTLFASLAFLQTLQMFFPLRIQH